MIEGKKFFAVRGYNKSGTNWLCRLLSLHPEISCSGEFHWNRISSQLIDTYNESESLHGQPGLLDATWHAMDRFIKEAIVLACDDDATWVGDRTPSTIEPSLIIGARVFNLIRDGRDIMISAAYHYFNNPDFFPAFNSIEALKEPLALFRADPTHFHRYPEQLLACDELAIDSAHYWAETIRKNQAKIDEHPEMKCLEVRYEALHKDIERQRKRVYEFLDVDPTLAAPLEFNTQPGFKKEQPNKFLRKGAVGDWKNYFSPRLRDLFNEHAGDVLVKLGYVDSLDWLDEKELSSTRQKDQRTQSTIQDKTKTGSELDEKQVAQSVSMASRARTVLAQDEFDRLVARPVFDHDGSVFPYFAVQAKGCRILDSAGREYVDWFNANGANLLGYDRPEVVQAIKNQMDAGPALSLMHQLEVEVAELLVEMIPCAELVEFWKNDSNAIAASLRLARAATNRKMVLHSGFGDSQTLRMLESEQAETFPFGDLAALESLLEKNSENVAAVFLSPINVEISDTVYLEGIQQLTRQHGAILIFNETTTAFRLANGGAQEYFGVVPDLTCVGNGIANGMPLAAVVGKREVMTHSSGFGFDETNRADTFSLAAAKSVLELLQREPVCERLAETGRKLRASFDSIAKSAGLNVELIGPDCRLTIKFHDCGSLSQSAVCELFLKECLKCGVMSNGTFLPSDAHDVQANEDTVAAFKSAMKVVKAAVQSGRVEPSKPESNAPIDPRAFVTIGFLEAIQIEEDVVRVHGWQLLADGAPDSIELVSSSGKVIPAECFSRPDIEAWIPSQPSALMSGYKASLPVADFVNQGQVEFRIVAKRQSTVAFQCSVTKKPQSDWTEPRSTNEGLIEV